VDDDPERLRLAVGDHDAFDVVYRRHRRAVATYVARRMGADGVEDVTAEVFVRAFRARAAYTPVHDSALPWLLGIASRVLSEQRRRERRRLQPLERLQRERPRGPVDTEGTDLGADLVGALRRLRLLTETRCCLSHGASCPMPRRRPRSGPDRDGPLADRSRAPSAWARA
jgi:RNA polymerase sigma-70 factor (ECF subfamily)